MISKIKPKFNIFFENAVKKSGLKVSPNTITLVSVGLSFIPFLLIAKGYFLVGAFAMLIYVFDLLDGAIARVNGKTTLFGGVLDATCDRFTDGLLFLALGLSGAVSWPLAMVTTICSFLVSYSKSKGETAIGNISLGTNALSIGYAERTERLAMIFAGLVGYHFIKNFEVFHLNILELAVSIILILSILTVYLRLRAVYLTLQESSK